MELMFQWFWVIKALVGIALAFSVYKMISSKFKSKFWFIMTIIGIVLAIISPVKMDLQVHNKQVQSNAAVESTKRELPPKVEDTSFKKSQEGIGIKKEELP